MIQPSTFNETRINHTLNIYTSVQCVYVRVCVRLWVCTRSECETVRGLSGHNDVAVSTGGQCTDPSG